MPKWDSRRRASNPFAAALEGSDDLRDQKLANRVNSCGSIVHWLERVCLCPDPPRRALVGGVFCDHRLCGFCAHLRALHWSSKLTEAILAGAKGRRYAFLTLTVRSLPKIGPETSSAILAQFAKLRETKEWRGISACAASVEFTKTAAGWHPHIHAILQIEPGVWLPEQAQWSAAWARISGAPVLDIRVIRPTNGSIARAVREVAKYAAKVSEIESAEDLLELHHAIQGRRLVITTGEWRKAAPPETVQEIIDRQDEFDITTCPKCKAIPQVNLSVWHFNHYRFEVEAGAPYWGERADRMPAPRWPSYYPQVLAAYRRVAGRARARLSELTSLYNSAPSGFSASPKLDV